MLDFGSGSGILSIAAARPRCSGTNARRSTNAGTGGLSCGAESQPPSSEHGRTLRQGEGAHRRAVPCLDLGMSGYARRVTRLPLVDSVLSSPRRADAPAEIQLSAAETIVAYHERTKHHYHRFAASLGYLDWATQLDPFRRYDGVPLAALPLPKEG